jgi:hypothetical protein
MKEMIGRVNDKEYIFNTLNGEFIFETKNWNYIQYLFPLKLFFIHKVI